MERCKEFNNILCDLDENNWLFSRFRLKKEGNTPILIGRGGSSIVYEMYNLERSDLQYAVKVIGFDQDRVVSDKFRDSVRLQAILGEESPHIVRIIDTKALTVQTNETGEIISVHDLVNEELWENDKGYHLQFVLMEKLEPIIKRDRFGKAILVKKDLNDPDEVINFALQIGQAIRIIHSEKVLHRDIKLENIFWDGRQSVYKLGDFGAAKYTETGNAETVIYTDGYGAPEIERNYEDHYNAVADIYSFGITLYLLLNDLKFPGSVGYYAEPALQYNPDYVFPAPINASPAAAKIISHMCAYLPGDRYSNMGEVMRDLLALCEVEDVTLSKNLLYEADIVTETFSEEQSADIENSETVTHVTRAERKRKEAVLNATYNKANVRHFIELVILFSILYYVIQTESVYTTVRWTFWALPLLVLVESFFQRIKRFHLFTGAIILLYAFFYMYEYKANMPYIAMMIGTALGIPIITAASAISCVLWTHYIIAGSISPVTFLQNHDMGWLPMTLIFLVIYRTIWSRYYCRKTSYRRSYVGIWIFDKVFPVMFLTGIVLLILNKTNVFLTPVIIKRMHFIITGVASFIGIIFFDWWDGLLSDEDSDNESTFESAEVDGK